MTMLGYRPCKDQEPISSEERYQKLPFQAEQLFLGNEIRVESYQNLPRISLSLPPMESHCISIKLTPPKGKVAHRCADQSYCGYWQPNDITVLPTLCDNEWDVPSGSSSLHVMLSDALLDRIAVQEFDIDPAKIIINSVFRRQDKQMASIGQVMNNELINNNDCGQLFMESLANAMALHLIKYYSNKHQIQLPDGIKINRKGIQKVANYIDGHLHKKTSIADMASLLGIGPQVFTRDFKKATGYTPHQYIMVRRIRFAREHIIKNPKKNLAQVAIQYGFADQSHMTRQFKRFTGLTPKQFRERH